MDVLSKVEPDHPAALTLQGLRIAFSLGNLQGAEGQGGLLIRHFIGNGHILPVICRKRDVTAGDGNSTILNILGSIALLVTTFLAVRFIFVKIMG